MSNPKAAAQAIDALRRGWPVSVQSDSGAITVLAIETADDARLTAFDQQGQADILLSPSRAATLKLTNQADADTGHAVCVTRTAWLTLPLAHALADPALDLAHPLKGPFETAPCPCPVLADVALELARHAGLLPAFYVLEGAAEDATTLTPADLATHDDPLRLAIVARARLPVAVTDQAEIIAFRSPEMAHEHVALVIGTPNGAAPLVRLHSECLTGDVLGSLKCDCGPDQRA